MMTNTSIWLCPGCTDHFEPSYDPRVACATCGVLALVELRVHTVASFDENGEGIDHRFEDIRVFDVTEERAIEIAEQSYPRHRILTCVEFLMDGPSVLRAACEEHEAARDLPGWHLSARYTLLHAVATIAHDAIVRGLPMSTVRP